MSQREMYSGVNSAINSGIDPMAVSRHTDNLTFAGRQTVMITNCALEGPFREFF